LIIFIHIPRTGDTVFVQHIRAEYGRKCVCDLGPEPITKNTKVLYGHLSYGVHNELGIRHPFYITILREPVIRVWSWMLHVLSFHHREVYDEIVNRKNFSPHFFSYVFSNDANFRNDAVKQIGRDKGLDVAIGNLLKHITYGLHEHYLEFLNKMATQFNWKPDVQLLTPSARKQGLEQPPDFVRDWIVENNQDEIELYNIAKRYYKQKII